MRLRLANSDATAMPPSTMPMLNAISSTASFTTFCCSPASNERTTMSGVRFDGATVSRKMIAKSDAAATARTRGATT